MGIDIDALPFRLLQQQLQITQIVSGDDDKGAFLHRQRYGGGHGMAVGFGVGSELISIKTFFVFDLLVIYVNTFYLYYIIISFHLYIIRIRFLFVSLCAQYPPNLQILFECTFYDIKSSSRVFLLNIYSRCLF